MNNQNKQDAIRILNQGHFKLVGNYTENALLLNACFIAAGRYQNITGTTGLSTTVNIPIELRLDNEIDVQYSNVELVKKYSADVQGIVLKNFIIVSVSHVDATLEDLYEHFLKIYEPLLTEPELDKRIRNAWTNDSLVNFLSEATGANLKRPVNLQTEFPEAFMRYSELRIIRHTLLHTEGKLSVKNYQKLQSNLANTPVLRQNFAILNGPIVNLNREIVLTINTILSIRQYLDRFIGYLSQSIDERPIV